MVPKKQLIYADDLIKIMRAEDIRYQDVPWSTTAVAKLCEPMTVDAVEVVRCKDCKYFVQGEPYDPCECMKWKVKFGVAYTEPNGYCHKAERKDNV